VIAVPLATIAWAFNRARHDWAYELRVVVNLGLLESLDSPGSGVAFAEVVLALPFGRLGADALVLVRADRTGEALVLLRLDEPRSVRSELCARWYDEATPLLLAVDAAGAVLHGPNAEVLTGVIEWEPARRCRG
jgi:hypothetical protein